MLLAWLSIKTELHMNRNVQFRSGLDVSVEQDYFLMTVNPSGLWLQHRLEDMIRFWLWSLYGHVVTTPANLTVMSGL